VRLAGFRQPPVKRDQLPIPMKGRSQCCFVKTATQPFTTAGDVTYSQVRSAVVVVRGEAGKCRSLLARETADLRHAHQNGDCGFESDTIHAFDQIEPFGEVSVLADGCGQALELGPQLLVKPSNFLSGGA